MIDLPVAENQSSVLSDEHIIAKSNQLITARQKLSLQERRIIYMFISLINPNDHDFRIMRLNVRDIANFIGIQKKNYYNTVKEIVVGLQKKGVYIRKDKSTLYVNWLASSEYYDNRGYVELEFSQKMKPYLLQLKKQFTQFKLKNVIRLKSEYSMQIYELLKKEQFRGKATFYLKDLRGILGLEPNTYKQMCHFKSRILDRAQDDLKKQTDIQFTYEDLKRGRKIVGFTFYIETNGKERELIENQSDQSSDHDLASILLGYKITKSVVLNIIKDYSSDRILNNISYIMSHKKPNNLAGAIVNAIKNDYAHVDKKYSDDQIIAQFISDKAPEGRHDVCPEFIVKDFFVKWAREKLINYSDDRIENIWNKNKSYFYKKFN